MAASDDMETKSLHKRRLAHSRRTREPDAKGAPGGGMQFLKEGQSEGQIGRAR